ncbi:MAG: phage holin family protein [Anaerovoracaceae bacterium]
MNNVINTYNLAVGGAITLLSAIFGEYWYLFVAFLLFNVIDYVTGWYKARRLKKESSAIGLKGVVKKVMYWILIATAFLTANVFIALGTKIGINLGFTTVLGWFVLASLTVNEIRSILENLVVADIPVPEFLVRGLAVADKLIDAAVGDKDETKE